MRELARSNHAWARGNCAAKSWPMPTTCAPCPANKSAVLLIDRRGLNSKAERRGSGICRGDSRWNQALLAPRHRRPIPPVATTVDQLALQRLTLLAGADSAAIAVDRLPRHCFLLARR